MRFLIDTGNTNTVFALHDGQDFRAVWRCRTETTRTAAEYASFLYPLFLQAGLSFEQVKSATVCSVVPSSDFEIKTLCRQFFDCTPVFADPQSIGIPIALDNPLEVGADRLVNALAVVKEYRYPAVVVDFGTATTFDVINKEGAHAGGVLAPGVNLAAETLHRASAKLPRVDIRRPASVIGTSTVEAMRSGLYWGYTGMVEGTLQRIEEELGEKPLVIGTGGLAPLFAESIPAIETLDADLTLRGLLYIPEK